MPVRRLTSALLVALHVLLLTFLVLTLFSAGALLLAFLTSWLHGSAVAGAGLLYRGAVCGLIAALFVLGFHLRRQVIHLAAPEPESFLRRVTDVLAGLGYAADPPDGMRHTFRPTFHAVLFGSAIRVELDGAKARVTGPKVYLELLRRRLRVRSYVEQAEKGVARCRGKRLLRQVEVELRLAPEQLDEVRDGVIDMLRQAGAEAVCHLTVLAHRDTGIPDAVVEGELRAWLRRHQLTAKVRKVPLLPPSPAPDLPAEDPGEGPSDTTAPLGACAGATAGPG